MTLKKQEIESLADTIKKINQVKESQNTLLQITLNGEENYKVANHSLKKAVEEKDV